VISGCGVLVAGIARTGLAWEISSGALDWAKRRKDLIAASRWLTVAGALPRSSWSHVVNISILSAVRSAKPTWSGLVECSVAN
jgi:hypothetical protein